MAKRISKKISSFKGGSLIFDIEKNKEFLAQIILTENDELKSLDLDFIISASGSAKILQTLEKEKITEFIEFIEEIENIQEWFNNLYRSKSLVIEESLCDQYEEALNIIRKWLRTSGELFSLEIKEIK